MLTQKVVAPGRAVPANDIDLAPRMADSLCQLLECVIKPRVKMPDIARPMVAQEEIQLRERIRHVSGPDAVDDVDPLAGMCVVQEQASFLRRSDGRGRLKIGEVINRRRTTQNAPNQKLRQKLFNRSHVNSRHHLHVAN